jgi:hypothetical protein
MGPPRKVGFVKEVGASARARKAGRQRKRTCFAIGCEAASGTAVRLVAPSAARYFCRMEQ